LTQKGTIDEGRSVLSRMWPRREGRDLPRMRGRYRKRALSPGKKKGRDRQSSKERKPVVPIQFTRRKKTRTLSPRA